MKVNFWKIDKEEFKATGTKMIRLFTFKPCSCGCTTYSGVGINLYWFGFNIGWKEVK